MGSIAIIRVGGVLIILGGVIFAVAFIVHDVGNVPWLRGGA